MSPSVAAGVASPPEDRARARRGCAALAVLMAAGAGGAGCDRAITLTIDGDRPVPAELDAICVGVADRAASGGSFGRTYALAGRLGSLPQTLAVEAGGADVASAWARGYRAGVVVAADRGRLDFADDVTLRLDRCPRAASGAAAPVAGVAAAATVLVASEGQGGTVIVAIDGGGAQAIDAEGDGLTARAIDGVAGSGALAFDADRDCDDDLAVLGGDAVTIATRTGAGFAAGARLEGAARAVAAADVDGDGDQDVVTAGGARATLWLGDGAGGYTPAAEGALAVGGTLVDATALATGDLDGDGHADLVIGQQGAPLRAFLGDPSGAGVLSAAPAVLPPVALDVRALALADLDGDGDADLLAAVAGGAPRLFVNRGGLLEQQGFVRLPDSVAGAAAAAGDWDGDCAADLIVAGAAATSLLHGGADGVFSREAELAGAGAAILADVDDDGDPDLITSSASEVTWYRR